MVFVTFSSLSSWKKGDVLFYKCVVIFLSFYRVLLWVLWETANCSKLGLSKGFPAQLCGFLGVGKGSLYWFKVICLGFLIKGLLV